MSMTVFKNHSGVICNMYRHYDEGLRDHGLQLAGFLVKAANEQGNLQLEKVAAWAVAEFVSADVGIQLTVDDRPGSDLYIVSYDEQGRYRLQVVTRCDKWGNEILFTGSPESFIDWVNSHEYWT